MSPLETSILIYGRDAQLLETRRLVLERCGARVWTATHLSTFEGIAAAASIDLIILCHSLSLEECGRALALANDRWPGVQSLVLVSGPWGCHSGFSKQIAEASLGPAYLLHAVEELIGPEHVTISHV